MKKWGTAPRPKTEEVDAFWESHGGRPKTSASLGAESEEGGVLDVFVGCHIDVHIVIYCV